jgi:DNA-binding transcriptional ArsR family regulator
MDDVFRGVADPTRRRILEMLADREMTAGEIADAFPIAFSSVSRHLGILRSAGLVATRREGQNIHYRLNTTVLHDVLRYFLDTFTGGHNA